MIIRSADEQDFHRVVSLIREFSVFWGAPETVTITAEQMIEDRHLFRCFVAETQNKEIIGFANCFFAYYSWTGKAMYLDDLYVTGAFRKQGIGRMLLMKVIELAKEQGCKKVRWQVSKWNTNAIEFYKSMGATTDEGEMNCDYILSAG
ncbi:MAG TPA: GNAT family N-acetyltransferase [Flavisolibacter sp.]